MNIIDASEVLIEQVLEQSHDAFFTYRSTTPSQRKQLLSTIAKLIEEARVELVAVAAKETHLPETRLNKAMALLV
jgi:NADP-dependent aldehyde dehydrogenase